MNFKTLEVFAILLCGALLTKGVLTTDCTIDDLVQKLLDRPAIGGLVYTRWGKTTCPSTPGTQLVYAGKTAGSRWHDLGGASNYICLPENPDYTDYQPGVQGLSPVYGTEYQTANSPLSSVYNFNAPCAVCYTPTRGTTLMIPAKTQCPPSWTLEYYGYLMAEDRRNNHGRTMYVCVDRHAEAIPGTGGDEHVALFFFTEAACVGISCPPYNSEKELTCVVCTK